MAGFRSFRCWFPIILGAEQRGASYRKTIRHDMMDLNGSVVSNSYAEMLGWQRAIHLLRQLVSSLLSMHLRRYSFDSAEPMPSARRPALGENTQAYWTGCTTCTTRMRSQWYDGCNLQSLIVCDGQWPSTALRTVQSPPLRIHFAKP